MVCTVAALTRLRHVLPSILGCIVSVATLPLGALLRRARLSHQKYTGQILLCILTSILSCIAGIVCTVAALTRLRHVLPSILGCIVSVATLPLGALLRRARL